MRPAKEPRRAGIAPKQRKRARRGLMGVLALLALGPFPAPGLAQRAGAPGLGVDGLPLHRSPEAVAVLALASDRWQAVSSRTEELLGDFRYLPEYASARARGQVFRVVRADRVGGRPEPGSDIVVVPWSFGPGCAEEGWSSPRWVSPGDTVAFLLQPTRVQGNGDDAMPVFDVLGWHQPYPVGELIPFWRRTPGPVAPWLTAPEFYRVLAALPTRTALENDPEGAVDRMRALLAASPRFLEAFPVKEMLAGWEDAWGVKSLPDPEASGPVIRRPRR